MSHDLARRWIDLALVGELEAAHRGALHDHLRACEACRDHYDRGAAALRVFEHADDLSAHELDLVEQWLFDANPTATWTGAGVATAAQGTWWRRPWLGIGAALAGATALVLWLVPPDDRGHETDTLTPRGEHDTAHGLGLSVLCGEPLRPADEGGCRLDESMTFAYRLPSTAPRGRLVLFGVDGHGDTLYYAPTPLDSALPEAAAGEWTPVPLTIDLAVNHETGPLTVFAVVTTNVAALDDVDAWAAALRDQPPARVGDDPWTLRLSSRLLDGICDPQLTASQAPAACRAAEFSLQLHEADR
jgi:hypothetical protein